MKREDLHKIPLLLCTDVNNGVDSDSINMKQAHDVTFLITFGADLSGNPVLKLFDGASAGAKTNALTFNYRYGGAAVGSAGADVMTAWATSAALTLTGTTFVSRGLEVQLDARAMTEGCPWLTLEFSNAGAAGTIHAWALTTPRYTMNINPTQI